MCRKFLCAKMLGCTAPPECRCIALMYKSSTFGFRKYSAEYSGKFLLKFSDPSSSRTFLCPCFSPISVTNLMQRPLTSFGTFLVMLSLSFDQEHASSSSGHSRSCVKHMLFALTKLAFLFCSYVLNEEPTAKSVLVLLSVCFFPLVQNFYECGVMVKKRDYDRCVILCSTDTIFFALRIVPYQGKKQPTRSSLNLVCLVPTCPSRRHFRIRTLAHTEWAR